MKLKHFREDTSKNVKNSINKSLNKRLHLIAHGIPGNRKNDFIELVARSYRKQYEKRH